MRTLGQNMAYLLKAQKTAVDHGIERPVHIPDNVVAAVNPAKVVKMIEKK